MSENTSELIDFRAILGKYLKKWYLFVISIVICVGIGLLASLKIQPKYEVRASVILNEESAVSQFLGGGMSGVAQIFGGNASAADEVTVMTAHSILRTVALDLGLTNTLFERKMPMVYSQITKDKPVMVIPDESTILTDTLRTGLTFNISLASKSEAKKVVVFARGERILLEKNLQLPAEIKTDYGTFTLMTTPYFNAESPLRYRCNITSPDIAAEDLRDTELSISQANKTSSIIEMQLIGPDEELSKAILNDIIDVYNNRSHKEKKQDSGATAKFLEDRLNAVRANLSNTEAELEHYKKNEGLGMIEADGMAMYERLGETEKLLTQQQAATEMARIALELARESAKDNSTIPPLSGSEALGSLINAYNTQVMRRMQLATAVKPDNQTLARLDEQISNLRETMIKTLEDAYLSSKGMEAELRRVHAKADTQIKNLPELENSFRKIARNQEIEEQIYIFLLQKQEEINVLFNDERPKVRVIDRAYSMNKDLSMSKFTIVLICLLLGLLIPPTYLYLKETLTSSKSKSNSENE